MSDEPYREPLSGWTPEREALAAIHDQLLLLIKVTLQTTGNKAPNFKQFPRPELAVHRLADRQARERHDRIHERAVGQTV